MAESAVLTGKKAPAFTLPDQTGRKVSLKDFAGKWLVLYFYPKDSTPGCTTEACEFTEGIQAFGKLGAAVAGVSPDSPESHQKFIAKYNLAFTLLSDPEHAVLEKYGAWGEKVRCGKKSVGVLRSTVLVNPSGVVAQHWPNVKAQGHAAEVRQRLEELQKP